MAAIVIQREADDRQSREVWDFHLAAHWQHVALVLDRYSIERRSGKGRYRKADTSDRWIASDERSYASGLPRPTAIPADVLAEAKAQVPIEVYVGWTNEASRLADASITHPTPEGRTTDGEASYG